MAPRNPPRRGAGGLTAASRRRHSGTHGEEENKATASRGSCDRVQLEAQARGGQSELGGVEALVLLTHDHCVPRLSFSFSSHVSDFIGLDDVEQVSTMAGTSVDCWQTANSLPRRSHLSGRVRVSAVRPRDRGIDVRHSVDPVVLATAVGAARVELATPMYVMEATGRSRSLGRRTGGASPCGRPSSTGSFEVSALSGRPREHPRRDVLSLVQLPMPPYSCFR